MRLARLVASSAFTKVVKSGDWRSVEAMSPLATNLAPDAAGAVAWALTVAWLTALAVPWTAVAAGASVLALPVWAAAAFSVFGVEVWAWAASGATAASSE